MFVVVQRQRLSAGSSTPSAGADRSAPALPAGPANAAGQGTAHRACFVLGDLIKTMMALKSKGNPTDDDIRAAVLSRLKDKSKEAAVNGVFDEVKAMGLTDDKAKLTAMFGKLMVVCPDVKPLAGMLKSSQ